MRRAAVVGLLVTFVAIGFPASPAGRRSRAAEIPDAPRFHNFAAPAGMGDSAGEPTLGVDWKTGKVLYKASTSTLRVTFDDCVSPARATWEDKSAPVSAVTFDPYLWVDSHNVPNVPNRCITSDLLPTKTSLMAYTDDDGENWSPSQGSGINSGVDHQTVGGGPYRPGFGLPLPGQSYPRAVYYCSQDVGDANCARSDDGGRTFGAAVPIYTLAQCGGLHGRLRVAPDGTVYVPNKSCGVGHQFNASAGGQSVVVSEDNGLTWNVRPNIPGSSPGATDPAVAIGADGTIYMILQNRDNKPLVATSTDKGRTWSNVQSLASPLGIQSSVFPVAVAGDGDRAAVGFLGTTTAGNYQDFEKFKGAWHLYIATTFDGGKTWRTVNATPGDPVQRGSICTSGTTCTNVPDDRNLLDFNEAAIDAEGRILIGFADGCIGRCSTGGPNSYSRKAVITRQSGGRRLFSRFDPVEPGPPGTPRVEATRTASGGIQLAWAQPDDRGATISEYRVYRSTSPDGEFTRIGTTKERAFEDFPEDQTVTQYYRVTAVSSLGESTPCAALKSTDAVLVTTPCTAPGVAVATDPPGDALDRLPAHDLSALAIAEPFVAEGPETFVVTMKVASLSTVPPNTIWKTEFTFGGKTYFVTMDTTDNPVTPAFEYGHVEVLPSGTRQQVTDGPADSGRFTPQGEIVVTISKAKVGAPTAGQSLSAVSASVQALIGATRGLLATVDSTGTGSYDVVGNQSCRPNELPLGALEVSPSEGVAPLRVRLDAGRSTDLDGDGIVSYSFDFGDGETTKQSSPTITHTYRSAGEHKARVRVTDGRGGVSVNRTTKTVDVRARGDRPGSLPATGGSGSWPLPALAAAALALVLRLAFGRRSVHQA